MEYSFSPSINIVRDAEKKIEYIPTTNSKNVFQQIVSNFKTGVHSFNVIGSYGTGKSAFLLALKKHLVGEQKIFASIDGEFNGCNDFKFINLIGQSKSLIETLAGELSVDPTEDAILKAVKKEHSKLKKKEACLVILVDEFGKFLEHAAKVDPDKELYFIQRLAELANDSNRNILFITTLHQNFDAYAIGLAEAQRKEWGKVKGRLRELTFNEPVEQLLSLASVFLSQKDFGKRPQIDKKLLDVINETGVFNLLNEVSSAFAKKLHPFDLLSAMVLTLSLQRYGQNERSLFNFLQTDEFLGLNSFDKLKKNNPSYNLACVYNYLQYNYYSVLISKFNPDYFKWSMIRNSLDRAELELTKDVVEAHKIIKTIGLLDVLGSNAAKINKKLLITYGDSCLGIKNTKKIIDLLESKKIIRYQAFKNRYKLFEGTDINIEELQRKAKKEVSQITNIVEELRSYVNLSYVPAKAVTYKIGTPRIFQFKISSEPITEFTESNNEIDGLVNLVFNKKLRKNAFNIDSEPIIYGFFKNPEELADQILEIKAIDLALTEILDDIAQNELIELKSHLTDSLNDSINERLFSKDSSIRWFYNGKELAIPSKKIFNQHLSSIAEEIYSATPVFRNELMNKSKVSSSIHFAKKQYIQALIENWSKPDLGFSESGMPPEKTIFYTLLRNTGIHVDKTTVVAEFSEPNKKSSFQKLWKTSTKFLVSAKSGKRSISEFANILSERPFKLKDGLIEFWIITFLFINREEFALFRKGIYQPLFNNEIAGLLFKDAQKYQIKTFDIKGVKLDLFNKYRELVRKEIQEKATSSSFQETARPFIVFYKDLSKYTKQTKALSHDAIAFRKVVKNAKELERTFFEELPSCFGVSMNQLAKSKEELDDFVSRINASIAELRTAESDLVDRVEKHLLRNLGLRKMSFDKYKSKINNRYKSLRIHLLNSHQEIFFNRLNSKLPDRNAWINSVVQALLSKPLSEMSDDEELVVINRLEESFRELDNLLEISQVDFDEDTEEAIKIEITSSEKEIFQKNIILSKEQKRGAKALEMKFRKVLGDAKDTQISQAILIKLLKEIIDNE